MDAFSYLSVLISIILGLAMTQLLQSGRTLLVARGHVRPYPPPLLWAAILLVMAVQMWWASFGLADHADWTFAEFTVLLLQVVIFYLMAGLVLPDVQPSVQTDGQIDLRAHYERERVPFFALALALLAVSLLKDVVIDGRLPEPLNIAFHGVLGAVSLGALLTRRPRYHQAAAAAVASIVAAYIVLLFPRL